MGNTATISGLVLADALNSELSLCRISGFLKDVEGSPVKGFGITVRYLYNPIGIVSTVLVVNERRTYRSDNNGYIQFDLVQGAVVDIELPNRLTDHVLHCTVPSTVSSDIIDFLFPYVKSVAFVTTSPQAMSPGTDITIKAQAVLSNGVVVAVDGASTTLVSSDELIVAKMSGFVFSALTPGTVNITVSAFNPAPLLLLLQPDGTAVSLQAVPTPTLPAALVINVA